MIAEVEAGAAAGASLFSPSENEEVADTPGTGAGVFPNNPPPKSPPPVPELVVVLPRAVVDVFSAGFGGKPNRLGAGALVDPDEL